MTYDDGGRFVYVTWFTDSMCRPLVLLDSQHGPLEHIGGGSLGRRPSSSGSSSTIRLFRSGGGLAIGLRLDLWPDCRSSSGRYRSSSSSTGLGHHPCRL